MCGFAGFCDFNGKININMDNTLVRIRHRGPDSQKSTVTGNGVFLGFVRLAIIDLSSDGEQPMQSEDGNVTVVFNGEIYNHVELRQKLRQMGHTFKSSSDTEVLLHMYLEYGIKMVDELEGMFAIALIDEKLDKIFLIRDRFGIKPLYYSMKEGLSFGSEIKVFSDMPGVTKNMDMDSIAEFLQYEYVQAPNTIFSDIKKMLPGHYMEIQKHGVKNVEYWNCDEIMQSDSDVTEAKKRIISQMRDSLKLHLRSDVPLGVFLSGGIDSGLLVAFASEQVKHLNTYTLRFENGDFDESNLAELVAKKYQTKHHCYQVSARDMKELMPKIVWYCDEPLGDSGILPNYIINELVAKDGIKVVLSGAGGDELFAGYNYYFGSSKEKLVTEHPHVAKAASNILKGIRPEMAKKIENALLSKEHPEQHMIKCEETFSTETVRTLIGKNIEFRRTKENYYRKNKLLGVNKLLFMDLKTYLPDDLLLLADRTTMAHSVEGRVPFLYSPLVEYAMSLSESVKSPERNRKWLLREIAKEYLPKELLNAPKMGFCSPIMRWATGEFGEHVFEVLTSERSCNREFWNKQEYYKFVSDKKNYKERFSKIYLLYVLEMYMRVHIDNDYSKAEAIELESIYG